MGVEIRAMNNMVVVFSDPCQVMTFSSTQKKKKNSRCGFESLQTVAMQAIFNYQNKLPFNHLLGKLVSPLDVPVTDQLIQNLTVNT